MGTIGIIGLDLDGTLLNEEKQISPRTCEALRQAAERGVHLVPVTGRPQFGIPELVQQLPFVRYLISCNGASTWDKESGGPVRERVIETETCLQIAELLAEYHVPYEVLYQGAGYAEPWVYEEMIARSPVPTFLKEYVRKTRRNVPDIAAFLRAGSGLQELFITANSPDQRVEIAERLRSLAPLNIVVPFPLALEVTAPGVDKGEALLALADTLGVPQSGVMAIGDSGNDLAMLKAAALPVAMGNATAEVKQMAKFVTTRNSEDGVGRAVERFVLCTKRMSNE